MLGKRQLRICHFRGITLMAMQFFKSFLIIQGLQPLAHREHPNLLSTFLSLTESIQGHRLALRSVISNCI